MGIENPTNNIPLETSKLRGGQEFTIAETGNIDFGDKAEAGNPGIEIPAGEVIKINASGGMPPNEFCTFEISNGMRFYNVPFTAMDGLIITAE